MEILNLIFTWIIGPGVTLVLGGIIGKKMANAEAAKKTAEVKTNELDNVSAAIAIWRETAEILNTKLAGRDDAINELKLQLEKVIAQNKELLRDMTILKKDYKKLSDSYNALKKSIEQ